MLRKRIIRLIFISIALCAQEGRGEVCAGASLADTLSLREVTVNAVRRVADPVIPAQTLSGDRMEALRSQSVADAVRYFSGVQIKDYGGVGGVKTVDMRSMGTNHLGVFYDGIQLGNAQNGQIDLGKFSLDNLEAIDIYNGQKSDIFQGAKDFGSAGTLYLQSRRPQFADGERWKGNVTFRTGSFGLVNPSVRFDYKISRNVSATVSAEYTYATGRYRFRYRRYYTDHTLAWDTTAVRRNGGVKALRTEAGVYGALSRGYWQGKVYFYKSSRGIPGAIVNNVWKNSQHQWDRNFFAQGRFRKTLTDFYSVQVNAKYAHDFMRYLNPDTTLMYIDNEFRQQEAYLSVANRFSPLHWLDFNLSADWQWNHLDASLVNFSRPVRHTLLGAAAGAVNLGRVRGQASLLWSCVTDHYSIISGADMLGQRSSRFSRLTPAAFVSWQVAEPLTIRAFYKRIFRMPTFNDLYYTDIGNADLKPEYATQWNFGAVYHLDFPSRWFTSLNLTADAYHNRVTDKIIAVPKGTGQYRWMMMNIGKVRITGVDVTADARMTIGPEVMLMCRLSYTYQQALDYSDPTDTRPDGAGTYRGQIAYIPRHGGSVAGTVQWRRAELNYSFIYVGERWHTSSNIPENYEPSWYTHDLSASYRFPLRGNRPSWLKLGVEVNNLFNQQYEVICNYPMPGRNFKVILTFDI